MLIKYHDKELYYLKRRIELLHRLDHFANQVLHGEEEEILNDDPRMIILRKEYCDVIDPESLCQTLKRMYPEELYSVDQN